MCTYTSEYAVRRALSTFTLSCVKCFLRKRFGCISSRVLSTMRSLPLTPSNNSRTARCR